MRTRLLGARIAMLGVMGSLGGCASASPQWEGLPPSDTYAAALTDLGAGDPVAGRASLAQVMEICGTTALGERAVLALIADALDPRNPDLDLAASLSHAYLSQPYRTPEAEQLVTSAYLVSLDVGGNLDESLSILPSGEPGEFPKECRSGPPSPTDRGPVNFPELPSQSLASRVADLQRSVEALEAELARVRETLRP